jgi:hypothetical protein
MPTFLVETLTDKAIKEDFRLGSLLPETSRICRERQPFII